MAHITPSITVSATCPCGLNFNIKAEGGVTYLAEQIRKAHKGHYNLDIRYFVERERPVSVL